MKNTRIIFIVFALMLFTFTNAANSQGTGSIILDHVDGLYAPDTIEVGKPITFHFRLQNNFGEAITGFSNGFRIYSPSEAIWDTADGAFTGAITPAMMDFGTFLSLRNVDGIGEDTIGFGGVSNFGTGIPDQFNDTVWSITIGPIAGSEHLKEICIDSSFYSPSNIWLWVLNSGNVIPDWGGPYCFTIFDATTLPQNSPPVLDSIGDRTVDENVNLNFTVTASDSDGTAPQLTSSALPTGALFTDNGEGTGSFDWTPDFTQAGTYFVTFYASDGTDVDSEVVTITVNDVRCPDLVVTNLTLDGPQEASLGRPIGYRLHATVQNIGDTVSGVITAGFFISADTVIAPPDAILSGGVVSIGPILPGDTISLEIDSLMPITSVPSEALPAFVFLGLNLDYIDSLAECNEQNNTDWIPIKVDNNLEPILDSIGDKTVNEGELLSFTVTAFDWDLDFLELFFFAELLSDSFFTDNGDGTGTFNWTPTFNDAGTFLVEFDVVDQSETFDFEELTITVNNVNQLPVIDPLLDTMTVNEGDSLQFFISATDFEDCFFSLQMSSPDLPLAATFTEDQGECGVGGEFYWQTDFTDAGTYTANFTVTDDSGSVGTDSVIIIVNNKNQPPRFDLNEGEGTNEGTNLNFLVSATDGDSTIPSLLISGSLPIGALFIDNGDGTGTFDWTPDFNQSGEHSATFVATDDSLAADTMTVFIFINEAGEAVLTVKNATCVQCSPPQNFTDIIVTESSFSIEFNNQIISASLEGNINFTSTSGQTFGYFYDVYSKLLYVSPFFESDQFQPADTITVLLSTGIVDLSESPLDSNYSLIYFTGPVVHPGDADNNGIVDERDILSLGLYWNLTGPVRELAGEVSPLEFFPSPGHFQVLSEKWEPNVAAYADADGSGTVNADDICGVSFNFGLSNQPAQKNNGDMPALKQLDNSVMQQLYNALIECPNSAGKTHLVEFLENAINNQSVILPTEVELYQNYPNPFNPSTTIEFYLPEQQYVTLDIYNILGQRVVSLVDREMDAGFQSVSWSGRDNSGSEVASGIYFYLLKTDDRKISKRMMMLK